MKTRAFTMLELVITISIITLLMSALTYMYIQYSRAFPALESTLSVTKGSQEIVTAVSDAARQADRIVSSYVFSGTTYTSGTTTVVFELPAISSSGVVIAGYDYIGIYSSSSAAYEQVLAAGTSARVSQTKTLTSALQSLSFTYSSSTPAQSTNLYVDATTTGTTQVASSTKHARAHVYLRNP